jgi:hypothetical protein
MVVIMNFQFILTETETIHFVESNQVWNLAVR